MSANGNGNSGGDDSGPGRREVAYRLFAAEFEDADFDYSESDEERAPNYVVTSTGARVNRMFAVGVLTEVQPAGEDILRARIADPTGTFVVYAGQYQPDAQTFLERAEPPAYVAVTGKARTFQPEDSDVVYTSIRPESLNEVDEGTRDRWTVQAARQTLERVGTMATAMQLDATGEDLEATLRDRGVPEGLAAGIPLALEHYGTTPGYLAAMRELAISAAEIVAGDREEVESLALSPGEGGDADLAALASTATIDAASAAATTEATATASTAEAPTGTETSETASATTDSSGTTSTETQPPETAPESTTTDTPDDEPSTADSSGTESTTAAGQAVESNQASAETAVSESDEEITDDEAPPSDSEELATSTAPGEASEDTHPGQETAGNEATAPTGDGDRETETASAEEDSEKVVDATAGESSGSDLGDFDGEFELDEAEREEIKSEFGTEFTSGTEVDEPGEADIDTPEPEDAGIEAREPEDRAGETSESERTGEQAAATADEPTSEIAESEPVGTEEPASEAQDDDQTGESAAEVDLEDAVMDAMADLDDGDGADREAVIASVVDEHGTGVEAVEDAIQDALMNGRCYEPGEGTLKPI